jgi:hypothetical protein
VSAWGRADVSSGQHDTQHLTEAVAAILSAWTTSLQLERAPKNPFSETRDHVAVRVRLRSKRALERFLKSHNVATINAIVCYWSAREVVRSASSCRLLASHAETDFRF